MRIPRRAPWVALVAAAMLVACGPADDDEDGFAEDVDCDDRDPDIYPGAPERCGNLDDDDCDGEVDEDGIGAETVYEDDDGDGIGAKDSEVSFCQPPAGYVDQDGDCDDTNDQVAPGAPEVCDGVDNNCNGLADDEDEANVDLATGGVWYTDGDGDGYGGTAVQACSQPEGSFETGDDCNDADSRIHPGAAEVCDNGVDNDCDGQADINVAVFPDTDGDDFGDPAGETVTVDDCTAVPEGYSNRNTDCDDTDAAINPLTLWARDDDGDGFGSATGLKEQQCEAPEGYVRDDTDCDDDAGEVFPGAGESCFDDTDNDCDQATPDTCLVFNEVLAKNTTDPHESDWLEIHNVGVDAVTLDGWGLTDDSDWAVGDETWTFSETPDVPPGGFLLVYANDGESGADGSDLWPNPDFKLSTDGEDLVLVTADGDEADAVSFPALDDDEAYARAVDGTGAFALTTTPTPGTTNAP